ncbi:hypothetical protein R1sor_026223 [Riccia sorocarpa]|uniref:Protein kinase domain-containing protein n=1 Tax=Riccia sorocarpa TaxID=122646 RepID=A0ABD3GAU2_9MARC
MGVYLEWLQEKEITGSDPIMRNDEDTEQKTRSASYGLVVELTVKSKSRRCRKAYTYSGVKGARLHCCMHGRQFHDSTMCEMIWVIVLLFSLVGSSVSKDYTGYISINCGGEAGNDSFTPGLEWVTDDGFLDSFSNLKNEGVAIRANVTLNSSTAAFESRENPEQMKTARVFLPGRSPRSKYCYTIPMPLPGVNATNYLVRAMFPSKNLSAMGVDLTTYGTRFYFTLDSTVISLVELDNEDTQTIELIVNSLDEVMYICLVPLEDRSSMAAISSLELRPLPENRYRDGDASQRVNNNVGGNATQRYRTYFITVTRPNFGGNLTSSRAYRDDVDLLWYPATIPDERKTEIVSRRNPDMSTGQDPRWNTVWEGRSISSNLSFTIDLVAAQAKREMRSFYMQLFFYDALIASNSTGRYIDGFLETRGPDTGFNKGQWTSGVEVRGDYLIFFYNYQQYYTGDNVTYVITANASSKQPPVINAASIEGEFDAIMQRTFQADALILRNFSRSFNISTLDTAGDPCYPVTWDWVDCSIDATPRITEMNLTGKGIRGDLPEDFGFLHRLTILDLSNNSFAGQLPRSLKSVFSLRVLKLDNNNLSGDLPLFKNQSLANLETLSLGHNNFSGNLSSLIQALYTPILSVNLTSNRFNGPIPQEIKDLVNLKYLDLSHNQLSGSLPSELSQLGELEILLTSFGLCKYLHKNHLTNLSDIWRYINSSSSLREIKLDYNQFRDVNLSIWFEMFRRNSGVYSQLVVSLLGNKISKVTLPLGGDVDPPFERICKESSGMSILLGGTPWCNNLPPSAMTQLETYLCRTNVSDMQFCSRTSNGSSRSALALIIGPAVSGLVVLLVSTCTLAFFLGRMLKRMKDLRQIQEALAKEDVRPPFYNYDDLKAATGEFSSRNELGRGSFGAVHKATLADASIVAVKSLFHMDQNISDFLQEMVLITGIKHKNLVQLKGCCVRDKKRMLIYEYAENGNLAEALWGDKRSTVLTWEQRLKISIGIAKGLSYLHEELQPKIIHRDIKPQNILLDKDWNPKIADFGLARHLLDTSTQKAIATTVAGTKGYLSPEYATEGLLTEKLDVYSYGVLLFEIVSGRKCLEDPQKVPVDEIYLRDWALKSYREGCLSRIAEASILASNSLQDVESLLNTALLCLQYDHERRPSMSQVVTILTNNFSDVATDIIDELKVIYADRSIQCYETSSWEEEIFQSNDPNGGFTELSITKLD